MNATSDNPNRTSAAARLGRLGCLLLAVMAIALIGVLWFASPRLSPLLTVPARLAALGLGILLAAVLVVLLLRRVMYRIGGRLVLSYFLVGVVPIPLLLLLLALVGYQFNGFFVGHLYRDAVRETHTELEHQARSALNGGPASELVTVATYRNGVRASGDPSLPGRWPAWLEAHDYPPFVRFGDDQASIAAISGDAASGALAVWSDELVAELSRRSGVLVSLLRSDAEGDAGTLRVNLSIGDYSFPLRTSARESLRQEGARLFGGGARDESGWLGRSILDRPILWWGELGGPLRDLATGEPVAGQVAAGLNATLRVSFDNFFSSSAEIDTSAWIEFVAVAVVASGVYAVAVLMAATLIFGVSRAVNRLSHGTETVRRGDFSARIPVRRKDQVGDLQRSFNAMTTDLEGLVATAAQKESLDKELAVARDLQQSLLPTEVPAGEQVEFATLFEPSAAIGGDFFDIVRLDDNRIAVVVADVAGHGLPTGLRMAMFKAALEILIADNRPIETILERLSAMIRSSTERRYFVTASISIVDFVEAKVAVTNAGHPPVYRIRGDEVTELLVPGTALGTLDDSYGRVEAEIRPGDFLVWMSDGLIEAANADGDVFGYERVMQALATPAATAEGVQRNLVSIVNEFTGGSSPDDDRTLVVMRLRA